MCPGNNNGTHHFEAGASGIICCTYCGCGPLKYPLTVTSIGSGQITSDKDSYTVTNGVGPQTRAAIAAQAAAGKC